MALTACFSLWLAMICANAQTSWSVRTDAPSNMTATSKLKFANGTFRLVWQPNIYFNGNPPPIYSTDLKETLEIPTPYSMTVSPRTMGTDPSSGGGSLKKLTLRYATSSGEYQAVVPEGSVLQIPSASHTQVGPGRAVNGFVVVSATYGPTNSTVDVKSAFRSEYLPLDPSYYYRDFVPSDFTYDASGSLLVLGSDVFYPAVAYRMAQGQYGIQQVNFNFYRPYDQEVSGAYGNGKLIMGFSEESYSPYFEGNSLIYSAGSSTYAYGSWETAMSPAGLSIKQISYQGGKFVAVGTRYGSSYSSSSEKGVIVISLDGVEWSAVVIDGTTSVRAVGGDGSRWVAVADSGIVLTSLNGYEWTRSTLPATGNLTSVTYGNGTYVVGTDSGRIYTSKDFTTWSFQMAAAGAVSSLAVGDGRFMAVVGTKVYQSLFSPPGMLDIVTPPATGFTVPGQEVVLSVVVDGQDPFTYQWYAGASGNTSQPIPGATGSTYQTPPLTSTKSYWVRVWNGLGNEDSTTAILTMQAPPVITAQPPSRTFNMGSGASTSVAATGNNISYQWYQGLAGDVSSPVAGQTSFNFNLPDDVPGVQFYWVRVSNDLGTVDSASIRVQVLPVPPVIVEEPLDGSTFQNDSKSLSVTASGPVLTYQWYGGASGDTRYPISSASSYFYPGNTIPGTFQYWVRVSNAAGFVDSRTASYTVLDLGLPIITRQPDDTATYNGSAKYLYVSAEGYDLKYSWYGGEKGDSSILLSDSSSSFAPGNKQNGTYRYWVRISNRMGSVDSEAVTYTVRELGKGLISKHPLDISTAVGNSISLSVSATGSGLAYQWYSGVSGDTTNPLAGKTSSSFTPPVTTVGQQSYWVRVTSGDTETDSQAAVVKVSPAILVITDQPTDMSVYVGDYTYYYAYTTGSNVTYQWYAGSSGDTSQPLADETSYTFDPPSTVAGVFKYWMRATSGADHVDSRTATVTVIGRPPVITTQPQDSQVAQGSASVSLSVGLDSSAGVTLQWYQGVSGDLSNPLSGKTGSSLSISNLPGGNHDYWVRASNSYGFADSRTARIAATAAQYEDWLVQNGLPSDASGLGARGASANQDGVPNLIKYALGMSPQDPFDTVNGPKTGTRVIGGNVYLTLTFAQSKTAQDVQVSVDEATNLTIWGQSAVESGPSYDNGDGKLIRTFRTTLPMNTGGAGFLRLKVTSN